MSKNNFYNMTKWLPDLPDNRDFKYKLTTDKLRQKVDLRKHCTMIENQGELGSCTGHAISSAIEAEMSLHPLYRAVQISRLFIYYQERKMEGTINSDAGASIRSGIKACAKIGACNEKFWPYIVSNFRKKPSSMAYADASGRLLGQYSRVDGVTAVLDCLNSGHTVVFGFTVYESFMSDEVAKTGIMPYPTKKERCYGGHAVLAVGYDMKKELILVKNSWGKDWGQEGYFWMPFQVIKNRNMSDDFWTVRLK